MKRELAVELIKNFHERDLPEVLPREMRVKIPESRKALAIIGPRRAGKTYLMYGTASELMAGGLEKENMLYVNLEDDRMLPHSTENLDLILRTYYEIYPEKKRETVYLFLDEIQNVPEWESFVRRIMDTEDVRVFLSGSSSKLLAREISTSMRGRSISYTLLPFSFREFLKAKGVEPEENLSSEKKAWLVKHLEEYLEYGGFPEIVLEKEADMKMRVLRGYAEVMLLRDIVERHEIKSVRTLRMMMNAILASFSKEFSINRFYNSLKSQRIKVSKNTLYDYMQHFEDAFFVFPVRKFDPSRRKSEQSLPKVYLVDTGYAFQAGIGFGENMGRYMENTVAIELMRREAKNPSVQTYYWKNSQGDEVDFVIAESGHVKEMVQVTYDMSDESTEKREVGAIVKASLELGLKRAGIITWNHEGKRDVEGVKVECIPLWKWLMNPGKKRT